MRHKKGHIIHVSLLVKPLFSLTSNEFKYMGFLQPSATGQSYILTDFRGKIDSFSQTLAAYLGISSKRASISNVHIFNIFP